MSDQDVAAILAAEEMRCSAVVAVDIAALDELCADDLVHIHSNGLAHNKAEFLAHLELHKPFVAVERGELQVRIHGDMAVINGPATNKFSVNGNRIEMSGVMTQVLRRENGKWRFINYQMTLIPAA